MSFEVGEKVAIDSNDSDVPKMWIGFEGIVLEASQNDPKDMTRIRPLSNRPDGFQLLEFLWYTDNLKKAE